MLWQLNCARCPEQNNRKKGVPMIDPKIKQSILTMRQHGATFAEIAGILSISPNTVKSICRRNDVRISSLDKTDAGVCKNCGQPLIQIPGKKEKTFCSNHCRSAWWNKNRSRKPYRLTCYCCGKEFIGFGNRKKKYCGQECYRLSRSARDVP